MTLAQERPSQKAFLERFKQFQEGLETLRLGHSKELGIFLDYALRPGGKAVRSLVMFTLWEWLNQLLGSPFQKPPPTLDKAARAVELLHRASLLHDDVVDRQTHRRGKLSFHRVFGEKTGILFGDYMLGQALEEMTTIPIQKLTYLFSRSASLLAEGQLKEHKVATPSFLDYFRIIQKKTASLFAGATHMVWVLFWEEMGRPPPSASLGKDWVRYGTNLGLAFQLFDDIRDYAPPQNFLEKTQSHCPQLSERRPDPFKQKGRDFKEKKPTYPWIWALHLGGFLPGAQALVEEKFQKIAQPHSSLVLWKKNLLSLWSSSTDQAFDKTRQLLIACGAFKASQALGNRYRHRALSSLDKVRFSLLREAGPCQDEWQAYQSMLENIDCFHYNFSHPDSV